jgi:succinate dehydrogenase / fumarate reductase iron-sulfur subunit
MAIASNQVTLKVFRLDPDVDRKSRYQEYSVEVREGMTVLEALIEIVEHQDATLSFRYSCRSAVCGSCAMTINGYIGLACQTQIKNLGARKIRIDPLPYMKVLKDLVVDMDPFYQKYERVKPYLIRKEQPPLEHEFIQMLDERHTLGEDNVLMCILCACCYGACPMDWLGDHYLGPAAIAKAQRFIQDSRDQGTDDRLPVLDGEDGVWRCHTVFNCVEACPKDIQLTRSIGKVKNSCTARGLRP